MQTNAVPLQSEAAEQLLHTWISLNYLFSGTSSLTLPLTIFTWRWLQDSRMGSLKPTIFHPVILSSDKVALWRAWTSTYRGLYLSSSAHGITGLSDINICCRRAAVSDRKVAASGSVTLPFWTSSVKNANWSLITWTNVIKPSNDIDHMHIAIYA